MSVPWYLKGTPYAVQQEALDAADGRKGFAYFLEQGLGKTGVFQNEIVHLHWQDRVFGAIGFAPKSLLRNWQREAEKMGFPGDVYAWPKVPTPEQLSRGRPFIIMINFEAAADGSKGEKYVESVVKHFDGKLYFFIDESSRAKNPSAKRTKQMLYFSTMFAYLRVGTGTPVTQSPADLWAQLKIIQATNLRFFPFRNRFCAMGGYMGKQVIGVEDAEGLQRILRDSAFSALKVDCTDLPEKQYNILDVPLTPKQIDHYDRMNEEFITQVDITEIEATMALTQMVKLQQIRSGFIRDEDKKVHWLFDKPKDIPVIQSTLDWLEESPKKAIIWFASIPGLESMVEALRAEGHNPAVVRGGMGDALQDEADKFNEDETCREFVGQIQAGGIGLTLLGQPGPDRCSRTNFVENVFGLEPRKQAEDRNHRHGQDEMVSYYDTVSCPADARMAEVLQLKEGMADLIRQPVLWKPIRAQA